MLYYDTIRNASAFVEASAKYKTMSFAALKRSMHWESAASQWGTEQLFACRVICKKPCDVLPLLAPSISSGRGQLENGSSLLNNLVEGPGKSAAALQQMSEFEIVRAQNNDSLGYVWAALAPLLESNATEASPTATTTTVTSMTAVSGRPAWEKHPVSHQDYVPSDGFQISSSPAEGRDSDLASSRCPSLGYMEMPSAPLVEDYTVRFLNCLIRCVLNYGQSPDKKGPFVQYRDERLAHAYRGPGATEVQYQAIDDGGVQLHVPGPAKKVQVALLEAKRSFQGITGANATVSDELLAQIVGEAVAASASVETKNISQENIVSIVAVRHYIKFFRLHITDEFRRQFESLAPTDRNLGTDSYLQVDSTHWFDMSESKGRANFVRHLLGLIEWADAEAGSQGSKSSEVLMDTD
ncbi:hypothetical protein FQN50_002539 [Emmonsiellopsis sp. PD_5]|nr:hypothetical protein FQN50_002539 [Emmonsiellopsis sp. PD_5]